MGNRVCLLSLSLAFLLAFVACNIVAPASAPSAGRFQYSAYDTSGTLVAQGWFTLVIADSTNIQGEWHFARVGEPLNIGPQVGEGVLKGGFYRSRLSVGLNPDMIDNNVILYGTLDARSFTGNWQWIGFPGVMNRGTFAAVRY